MELSQRNVSLLQQGINKSKNVFLNAKIQIFLIKNIMQKMLILLKWMKIIFMMSQQ